MFRIFFSILFSCSVFAVHAQSIEQKVSTLLNKMTLQEKIGQLNQYAKDFESTGPTTVDTTKLEQIKKGMVGSMLNVRGAALTRQFQEAAMQSRLKIPLLFGLDVIHGYRVTFPIPLAEAASWDLEAIERSARIAATEAAASGIHWTFAPMVDNSRDPRWGRVMEGAGEDTYLGSKIAYARVKGFQGKGLGNTDAIMACAKHFLGYGAAVGGRDYNSVDMSMRNLWENYLPPFKATVDAGVGTFMNSFNDVNGIPATANKYLQRDILKGLWAYKGFVVSDWASIGEMVNHGYSKDKYEAAEQAINAGSDMDMESRSYIANLEQLVKDGKVKISTIDDAVKRILRKKFELGLFDDPFRFSNPDRERQYVNRPEYYQAARDIARKSIVLLQNRSGLLPLSKGYKKIGLIGPFVKATDDLKGSWSLGWDGKDAPVTVYDGLQNQLQGAEIFYAKGCDVTGEKRDGFKEAVEIAKKSDVVIVTVGEESGMSGEAKSRADITLPGVQEELVKEIQKTGKPVIVLIMAGRPMVFNWIAENMPSVLYAWWLGSEAGNAIADVLTGKYNPSAKLPMTFPRSVGQIPVYYNYYNTGRPTSGDKKSTYTTGYIDLPISPQYPFGHGLSYTNFQYSDLKLSHTLIRKEGTVTVSFNVSNTGKYDGEEVVQLYIRDVVASPLRPVKELKDFKKVLLKAGETKKVSFSIDKEKLSFYNEHLKWVLQPGEFKIMIGSSSNDIRLERSFKVN